MGSFVISIDAELAWGFHDLSEFPTDRIETGRDGWSWLLDCLNEHSIPATWAVVGHLMLDDCDGVHADLPSIDGWFDHERDRWSDRSDLRFSPDLVDDVVQSETDHEIASHTFSHVLFDDPRVTERIARSELDAAVEAANRFGIDYETLIFPRNAVGYRELLDEFGFTCYRSRRPRPSSTPGRIAEKLLAAVDPNHLNLITPTVDEYGLVDVPPSLYLFGFEGWPRQVAGTVGVDPIVRQAKRGIDRASRTDGLFHVWLHPNDICTEQDERRIASIVAYAAQKRDTTSLSVETMATVADRS
ncbi:polysaccharide deacetylase family protein [Haloarcula sp. GH36]|uniref:polysaccharide deacetylase family protein n=1 Tax=Haloarcula montana TaxID=3111776 RepID=UPI002D771645|nr:polysaccharide deacetylase family protein [Haloarcula sp. GH36]